MRNVSNEIKLQKNFKASSQRWLKQQMTDPYVMKAKKEGYRSRAAYKLLEIHEKFTIFQSNMIVIDLGAAPGGWSQVAAKLTKADNADKKEAQVIAMDLLPIPELPGVITLQQDFFDSNAKQEILSLLSNQQNAGGYSIDVVMSDMAPNTIGHSATDHLRIMNLCEAAYDFAITILKPGGHFIAKVFRGGTEG